MGAQRLAAPPSGSLQKSPISCDNYRGRAWPDRSSFRSQSGFGSRGHCPASRRVKRCLPAEVAGHVQKGITLCAKSSPFNVRTARTGTTRRPRTRRPPPVASSSPSSATPAASTRRTKRRSSPPVWWRSSSFVPQHGGVSSTVKLSVSKTELLGSNPSSPASLLPLHRPGRLNLQRFVTKNVFQRQQAHGQDRSN